MTLMGRRYLSVCHRVKKTFVCQLALVAGAVPNEREERVPGRNVGVAENLGWGTAPSIAELRKVYAGPGYGVQLVLLWI